MNFVLLAAGRGRRLGVAPSKGLVRLNGRLLIDIALANGAALRDVDQVVIVTNVAAESPIRRALECRADESSTELVVATTRSAFDSLLVASRYVRSTEPTLIGTVDSVVSRDAVEELALSTGDGCILVRPGDDPDGVYVTTDLSGKVVGVGLRGPRIASSWLSAGWLIFRRDLLTAADAAWADGVRVLRVFQDWLAPRYDIRRSITEHGYDIDTADDLERARRDCAMRGWAR